MCVTSLIGSVASKFVAEEVILVVFAMMALLAAYMMLRPKKHHDDENNEVSAALRFSKPAALLWGMLLGFLSGLVGQGGGFIFVPVMLYVLKVPTRITIGTALIVGIASSSAVLTGRAGTLQIPYMLSLVTVAGAIIGAQIGAKLSQLTPRHRLRQILSGIIVLTAARMLYSVMM